MGWIFIGVACIFGASTLSFGPLWTFPPALFGLGVGILLRVVFGR